MTQTGVAPKSSAQLSPEEAAWKQIYIDLDAIIKMHHYSPRTYKTYATWIRQLQHFTRETSPESLTTEEVKAFLTHLDLNFDIMILTVHDGKGQKDRTVPLLATIADELRTHLDRVHNLHGKDMESGYDGTFMFGTFETGQFPRPSLGFESTPGERTAVCLPRVVLSQDLLDGGKIAYRHPLSHGVNGI